MIHFDQYFQMDWNHQLVQMYSNVPIIRVCLEEANDVQQTSNWQLLDATWDFPIEPPNTWDLPSF